jgi:hypothetical protein
LEFDRTRTSTLAIIYKQEGHNPALRDCIMRYEDTDRHTEVRQLANAVDLFNANTELDKREKAEIAELIEEVTDAAIRRGKILGTIDIISKMVGHASNEPPE